MLTHIKVLRQVFFSVRWLSLLDLLLLERELSISAVCEGPYHLFHLLGVTSPVFSPCHARRLYVDENLFIANKDDIH